MSRSRYPRKKGVDWGLLFAQIIVDTIMFVLTVAVLALLWNACGIHSTFHLATASLNQLVWAVILIGIISPRPSSKINA